MAEYMSSRRPEMSTKAKILIVDDEVDFTQALKKSLETKGCQVVIAGSKDEATDVVNNQKFDMVIVGTIRPRGAAFQLHVWLKETPQFSDMPLLVIDAPVEERLIKGWLMDEGLELRAEDYVSKPIKSASLVPRIEKLLAKAIHMIKVLVVDDHAVVREGIGALLALQKDMEVIGEAENGKEAIDKVQQLFPDVVLMDIVMPVMSGLDATKRISEDCPQTKILMLTQYDDKENMFVAKQSGAFGFVAKKAASSDLLTGIRTVSAGRYFPRAFAYVTANW
jgi:DNA-binding NarL/FixJ family response regulator